MHPVRIPKHLSKGMWKYAHNFLWFIMVHSRETLCLSLMFFCLMLGDAHCSFTARPVNCDQLKDLKRGSSSHPTHPASQDPVPLHQNPPRQDLYESLTCLWVEVMIQSWKEVRRGRKCAQGTCPNSYLAVVLLAPVRVHRSVTCHKVSTCQGTWASPQTAGGSQTSRASSDGTSLTAIVDPTCASADHYVTRSRYLHDACMNEGLRDLM